MNTSVNGGSKNWGFPNMKTDEIVVCMNVFGVSMVTSDLAKPTPGKMQLSLCAFLDVLMGLPKGFFEASVEACAGEADHFDIYADTLLLTNFFHHARRLTREVGFTQLQLQDLIKPDALRMRKILSAILNFAKFREEQLDVYDKFTLRSRQTQDRHDELLDKHDQLIHEIKELKERRETEAPLVEKARATNDGLKNELHSLKRDESAVIAEYDKVKTERQELTARLDRDATLLQTTEREVQKVRSRIVHSPEKLKQQLVEMSSSLSNEKVNLHDKSKKARELTAKIDILTVLESDVQSCNKLMEECDAGLERVEAAHRRVTQLEETVENKRYEVTECSHKESHLRWQLGSAEERLNKATTQLERKREAMRAKMAHITGERREVQAERLQIDTEMEKKRALVASMQDKIAELRGEFTSDVATINAEFGALTSHVDLYMKEVQLSMNQSAIVV